VTFEDGFFKESIINEIFAGVVDYFVKAPVITTVFVV
jgi:hypothetical protein